MSRVPLSVLDLVPVSSGSTPAEALANTVDLAVAAERAGYARYWLAEHHLNPGVAGSAPTVVIGAVAAATSTMRVGSAATLVGNVRGLQIAETFGTLAALYGPRIDLGLGRSGAPAPGTPKPPSLPPRTDQVVDGLLVPAPFRVPHRARQPVSRCRGAARTGAGRRRPVRVRTRPDPRVVRRHVVAGRRGGRGAPCRGRRGRAVDPRVHRRRERPDRRRARPALRRELPHVAGHGPGVRAGVPRCLPPRRAGRPARHRFGRRARGADLGRSGRTRARVRPVGALDPFRRRGDRVPDAVRGPAAPRSQPTLQPPLPIGSRRGSWAMPRVADRLEVLRRATGADELLVTTITHDHDARVRS
ncbi:LLM class flavin-dependent oxidoreductase [Curtobacterium flaccumfaciens]|nr:LLM class flavin-dependent oxidoreductase [Curtobacterium flaccumfaciens]